MQKLSRPLAPLGAKCPGQSEFPLLTTLYLMTSETCSAVSKKSLLEVPMESLYESSPRKLMFSAGDVGVRQIT